MADDELIDIDIAEEAERGDPRMIPMESGTSITLRFKRRKLSLRILDRAGQPIEDTSCTVAYSNGKEHQATTDADGWLKVPLSGKPEKATLTLEGVEEDAEREVYLQLPSLEEEEGVSQRLANLGFSAPELWQAVLEFQDCYDLEPTGEIDDEFREKLAVAYEFQCGANENDDADPGEGDPVDEDEAHT